MARLPASRGEMSDWRLPSRESLVWPSCLEGGAGAPPRRAQHSWPTDNHACVARLQPFGFGLVLVSFGLQCSSDSPNKKAQWVILAFSCFKQKVPRQAGKLPVGEKTGRQQSLRPACLPAHSQHRNKIRTWLLVQLLVVPPWSMEQTLQQRLSLKSRQHKRS